SLKSPLVRLNRIATSAQTFCRCGAKSKRGRIRAVRPFSMGHTGYNCSVKHPSGEALRATEASNLIDRNRYARCEAGTNRKRPFVPCLVGSGIVIFICKTSPNNEPFSNLLLH